VIKTMEVYSTLGTAAELTINNGGLIEDDFIQVKDIQGLDPVKAGVDTVAAATRDGLISLNTDVASRNIIIILRANADWNIWSPETLRKFIYSYFIPKNRIKLIFDSDEYGLVTISGVVESCDANPFSKDPEFIISLICEDPYFTAVNPVTAHLPIISPGDFNGSATDISLDGTVPIGFTADIAHGTLTTVWIQVESPSTSIFTLAPVPPASSGVKIQVGSIPGQKYVRLADTTTGAFTNILKDLVFGSVWPFLQPGDNKIAVMGAGASGSGFSWDLTYYKKYGGI
jgi:hypothetical protein